jgi:septal ring factor EnvC (AmiA/AmiB activator)
MTQNPYPAPDANPLQVIQAEIAWLLDCVRQMRQQESAVHRQIMKWETRIHDLRRHLERLEREDIDTPLPLGTVDEI